MSYKDYFWGTCIGLLQIPAFFSFGSLGASTPYEGIAFLLHRYLGMAQGLCHFETPKGMWQLGIFMGILMGSFLGRVLFKHNNSTSIQENWGKLIPSYSLFKRLLYAFIGGFFMIYGARLAVGCTSGNGISGIALLFVGSYIVIGSAFLFGTITAFTLYKREN